MQPTHDQIKQMQKMNLAHRFHDRAQTFIDNPVPGGHPVPDRTKPPCVVCDVFDKTTNQLFFSATGTTEAEAFALALEGAVTADKPLTPAQKSDPRFAKIAESESALAAANARIAELEAQVRSASEAPPRQRRGQPAVDPS